VYSSIQKKRGTKKRLVSLDNSLVSSSFELFDSTKMESAQSNTSSSGLGVLSSALQLPQVSESSVSSRLLPVIEVLTPFLSDLVGMEMEIFVGLQISTSVEEVERDSEVLGLRDDNLDLSQVILGQFTSSLVRVNASSLADNICKSSTNTLDSGQSVDDFQRTVNIGVQKTEDVRKIFSLHNVSHG